MRQTYLDANCTSTLREAIAELRGLEGVDDASAAVAPEIAPDLDIHDVIHVLFACSTDLRGEILAHIWTMAGTTAKVADLHRVTTHRDHRQALRRIGHGRLLWTWVSKAPLFITVFRRARQMKRRFPVHAVAQYLDRPLCDIRRDFGIRLPARKDTPSGPSYGALVRRANQL